MHKLNETVGTLLSDQLDSFKSCILLLSRASLSITQLQNCVTDITLLYGLFWVIPRLIKFRIGELPKERIQHSEYG